MKLLSPWVVANGHPRLNLLLELVSFHLQYTCNANSSLVGHQSGSPIHCNNLQDNSTKVFRLNHFQNRGASFEEKYWFVFLKALYFSILMTKLCFLYDDTRVDIIQLKRVPGIGEECPLIKHSVLLFRKKNAQLQKSMCLNKLHPTCQLKDYTWCSSTFVLNYYVN